MADQFPVAEAVLQNHLAVLGKTGSGKTSIEKLIIEHVVAQDYRVCILDPIKSDWWGITSSSDGKKSALPFTILGGPHGHTPLHSSAGKTVGQLVGTGQLRHSIIDMANFEAGGLQRFFVEFSEALFRHASGITYLVIEEAHEFAPKERAGFGGENMALHWAKKLATAGRSKGIRLLVASQRVQQLHNSVLGSCETLIALRLTQPPDQEPVLKWLKANTDKDTYAEVAGSLASLPTGTGWVCSGEAQIFEKVAFPKFKTYDNSATPTKEGRKQHAEVQTTQVDMDQLRTMLGKAADEAAATDPKALQATIVHLRKDLAAKAPTVTVPVIDEARETQIYRDGYKTGRDHGYTAGVARASAAYWKHLQQAVVVPDDTYEQPNPKLPAAPAISPRSLKAEGGGMVPNKAAFPRIALPSVGGGAMSGPQRRILNAVNFWHSIGHDQPTREQVALVAGYSPTSTSFTNPLGGLRTSGAVDYPAPGRVQAKEQTGDTFAASSAAETLRKVLTGPQLRILDAALQGDADRPTIAQRAGYSDTSTSFTNPLGGLRTLGLIEYPSTGQVAVTSWVKELM